MAKTIKKYVASHIAGEWDPALHGRIDTKNYFYAADKIRNLYTLPQGGVKRRPGTLYVGPAPLPSPVVDRRCKQIPFHSSSIDGGYNIVIGFDDIHIYGEDGIIRDTITGTGFGNIVQKITSCQTTDSLILFIAGYQRPQRLRRISDTNWTLTPIPLRAIPQYSFEDTAGVATDHIEHITFINFQDLNRFKLFINGTETAPIAWRNGAPATTAANIKAALEALPFISAAGAGDITVAATVGDTQFDITFGGTVSGIRFFVILSDANMDSGNNDNLITMHTDTKGQRPQEDVWADFNPGVEDRGWPRCGVFFQNRLWMAGSPKLPNAVWASRVGDAEDFLLVDDPPDDAPIFKPVDVETGVEIYNMFVGRHLQIFAGNTEFYVPVSENEAVTPSNLIIRSSTSIGTLWGSPTLALGGSTLFLQRNGRAVRAFVFVDTEQAYKSFALTKNGRHLLASADEDPFVALTRDIPINSFSIRKSNEPDEPDTVYIVNEAGGLVVVTVDQEENILSSQLWITNGNFVDVNVVNQKVFVLVERSEITDAATEVRLFIEVFDSRALLDAATIVEGIGAPVSQSSDLTYLENFTGTTEVEGIVDGISQGLQEFDDTDTIYEFSPDAEASWQVGLPFPDVKGDGSQTWLRSLPMEIEGLSEPLIGTLKAFARMTLRLLDTGHIRVQGEDVPLNTWPEGGDVGVLTRSGDFKVEGLQITDELFQLDFTQTKSQPLHLLSYAVSVNIGDE